MVECRLDERRVLKGDVLRKVGFRSPHCTTTGRVAVRLKFRDIQEEALAPFECSVLLLGGLCCLEGHVAPFILDVLRFEQGLEGALLRTSSIGVVEGALEEGSASQHDGIVDGALFLLHDFGELGVPTFGDVETSRIAIVGAWSHAVVAVEEADGEDEL